MNLTLNPLSFLINFDLLKFAVNYTAIRNFCIVIFQIWVGEGRELFREPH